MLIPQEHITYSQNAEFLKKKFFSLSFGDFLRISLKKPKKSIKKNLKLMSLMGNMWSAMMLLYASKIYQKINFYGLF